MSDEYETTEWHGHTFNMRTIAMLKEAERQLGYELTVTQGSYNAGTGAVSASSGTHDGGGAADLAPWDYRRKVKVLRGIGFAAWHRMPDQGPWPEHVHCIALGDEAAAQEAKNQMDYYLQGLNGLASHLPDDSPRPDPIPIFDYTQEIDMQLTDKIPGTKDKTVGDALKAALESERSISALRAAEGKRQKALAGKLSAAQSKLDDLPEGVTKSEVKALLENIDANINLVIDDADSK